VTRKRPAPQEAFGAGERVVAPRLSASLLLLRGGDGPLEVLLVQRSPQQRFMGGFWVFPGGAVEPGDGAGTDEEGAHRAAAVRELAEEAAIEGLDPAALVAYSRWVTPATASVRFDTRFYLGVAPAGAEPRVDGRECVDARWFAPRAALEAYDREELPLVVPTLKQVEGIARFGTAAELLEASRDRVIEPITPQVVGSGAEARIVLPGEPGYVD
jgi:8-oxo-dGTP pyrophosphatase MutT (NUDIX family)